MNEASAASDALAALKAGGFNSSADNAAFKFSENGANPLAQFNSNRKGDMGMGEFIIDLMNEKEDPRINLLFTPNADGQVVGWPAKLEDRVTGFAYAELGPYWANKETPFLFASFSEAKFIEAVALVRSEGVNEEANEAFKAAIEASMQWVGVEEEAIAFYIEELNLADTKEAAIKQIIEEKYVSLFNHPEAFNDWRRTGYPELTPTTDNFADMPRRFPYPQTEVDFNVNTPKENGLTQRVWWDS
ncbi:SusD/RagB family nutrient-binding outer membrane lipoprotein [Cytophagales bacterium RKSG123]|nr:SusD/RagB family nutrient-binding outer membrane lipoprotein [Xanthovirga aplysinae]